MISGMAEAEILEATSRFLCGTLDSIHVEVVSKWNMAQRPPWTSTVVVPRNPLGVVELGRGASTAILAQFPLDRIAHDSQFPKIEEL